MRRTLLTALIWVFSSVIVLAEQPAPLLERFAGEWSAEGVAFAG